MKRSICMVMVLWGVVAISTCAFAQVEKDDKQVLRGLDSVHVTLERLQPEIERDGLYGNMLVSDAEMKLKLAGIKVLSEEERIQTPYSASLYLRVNALKRRLGYIYRVELFLVEPVALIRNKMQRDAMVLEIPAEWGMGRSLTDIREKASDAVDRFIRAWLDANTR